MKAEGEVVPVQGMKECGELKLYLHELRTLALYGDEWSALCPGRFVPETDPLTTVTMRLCV
jgi:hypothetical protein